MYYKTPPGCGRTGPSLHPPALASKGGMPGHGAGLHEDGDSVDDNYDDDDDGVIVIMIVMMILRL